MPPQPAAKFPQQLRTSKKEDRNAPKPPARASGDHQGVHVGDGASHADGRKWVASSVPCG
eukprot:5765290-Pyramimonas_sp.AAC.1